MVSVASRVRVAVVAHWLIFLTLIIVILGEMFIGSWWQDGCVKCTRLI
jgi:hypothetical protein